MPRVASRGARVGCRLTCPPCLLVLCSGVAAGRAAPPWGTGCCLIASHCAAPPGPRTGPARAVPAVCAAPRREGSAGQGMRPAAFRVRVSSLSSRRSGGVLRLRWTPRRARLTVGRQEQSVSHGLANFRGKTCHSCWGGMLGSALRPAVGWRNHLTSATVEEEW